MFFTKYPHRANFDFAQGYEDGALLIGSDRFQAELAEFPGDVYRLKISGSRWNAARRLCPLTPPSSGDSSSQIELAADGSLALRSLDRRVLLKTSARGGFGVSGSASMLQFAVEPDARFFGMGEKVLGRFELSGLRTKFWNTDVWGDFHFAQWNEHSADPQYLSVPYVIVGQAGEYFGLLMHNAHPTFIETPGRDEQRIFVEWQLTGRGLTIGCEGGEPDLWIIYGPSLKALTRKLQMLVGPTPTPPTWALGYHQSRWGYRGQKDLEELDEKFRSYQIPCDGLWLDIDYMDGFRVFTHSSEHFPGGPAQAVAAVPERRVVPILDPGVKREPGYRVFDDGLKNGVFCLNEQGKPFVGMVWPGETVFPDFTLDKARSWWAGYADEFMGAGYGGAWLDMNDPSTGPVDPSGMLFDGGKETHAARRNEFALGMQMATCEGFLRARPEERPFLLSRSGFVGTSKYAAVWTGDNLSNRFYLKAAIPTSLNLALSGIPFNGPDVGGFGGDCDELLMLDWVKCCFLFPFMRNHSNGDWRAQEPWAYSRSAMNVIRDYIRLRYRLMPYLYNLFVDQEARGEAILRPLIYDFEATPELVRMTDQFMVGPHILQAPLLEEEPRLREVILPGDVSWLDARTGEWLPPGAVRVSPARSETPLYVRSGAIIPVQRGTIKTNRKDLDVVDFHVFCAPGSEGESFYFHHADDGKSLAYRSGSRTTLRVRLQWNRRKLEVEVEELSGGFGSVDWRVYVHGQSREMKLSGRPAETRPARLQLVGKPIAGLCLLAQR